MALWQAWISLPGGLGGRCAERTGGAVRLLRRRLGPASHRSVPLYATSGVSAAASRDDPPDGEARSGKSRRSSPCRAAAPAAALGLSLISRQDAGYSGFRGVLTPPFAGVHGLGANLPPRRARQRPLAVRDRLEPRDRPLDRLRTRLRA